LFLFLAESAKIAEKKKFAEKEIYTQKLSTNHGIIHHKDNF
jgi:hypothetical protein